ncbi:MAG: SDR family oxidoreductase [Flavobacteriaceae bacterium]|nr:SDR family oxidoreductase [Flavobacteriaceae bacterium]
MKILLTGATGYIGKRLLPLLVKQGHTVVCCVRDSSRFEPPKSLINFIEVVQVDLLKRESLDQIPKDIDGAYYLVHSMSASQDYKTLEKQSAENFKHALTKTRVKHVIYLSGIVNEQKLSEHLLSRKQVEESLQSDVYALTTLRAGIIIGSGSASFEIIRDLVEKLPLMITPKWLNTRCQPIGVSDVLQFLAASLFRPETFDKNFDIGGPDILTYKEMLLGFAKVRKLKRSIFIVPVMTPRLSSYWLYFVTSTSYRLATALVNSMKIEVICRNNDLATLLHIEPLSYEKALKRAFDKIENNDIYSSWKDSFISGQVDFHISDFINVPLHGCFKDQRTMGIESRKKTVEKIWKIGGEQGWYYANTLWRIRGFLDKLFGGVGLRRGRTNKSEIHTGDALDFWRVLYANKAEGRLLLFAEMKLPGEAWLEFKITGNELQQTATFRPRGILGRLYWYAVLPFHGMVFSGMLKNLARS